ncbi:BZIP-type transcription factor MBZ1 [Fulvia fulva]|uniref:BZIP-type transcription factor MBZ1 n=1 Tax=Passalora fulva TaxID=5499 RepID=A0A9Q8LAR1_PASFU|nr:BZIP-type transcription factor MBZ1 [Fulvia fulva]KAK4631245.1 BZIP-type transcription factor MBZ1 [Fulvia fulva]UJO13983.1 BZIP-type transcription factor MBZ1 [Fulvia fulva]WPV10838.1 BZIP-type transcription factor MBZ1 [Fulvia fulva]WPV26344.1 BZIP-type transcription factor MBZ1 [Fulvia fulva]
MAHSRHHSQMSRPTPQLKTEQFDMDSFFDFNQGGNQPSPVTASSSRTDALSPFEKEEQQKFNGPSHDYGQFKQQVGLPVGSMANMPVNGMYDGFNSGVDDMRFNSGFGWNTGLDMDADMGMDYGNSHTAMPAMFFPPNDSPADNYVNPNSVGGHEEPPSNVGRLWPGMHSQQAQQAAMQKAAQAQAVQQRQLKLQAQQAQYRQVASQSRSSQGSSQQTHGNGKRASHASEPHVEESISRLLNQMRQNSHSVPDGDDADSPGNMLPHIARMKKDEEEMDEDERLLASDEGKKLSSKERRQLRNKVSARAFRSRRKEYIGQLEGEVAMKAQESNVLRQENQALQAENERYRGLIETLLRHPAFTPFINDISQDPSVLLPKQHQQQRQQLQPSVAPTPQPQPAQPHQQQQQSQPDVKPEYLNFDASLLQIPQSQPEQQKQQQQQVGLAMIPENDFSKLNINGFNAMNFQARFNSVNAYAVTELTSGPDPVELLIESPIRLPCSASATSSTASPATCSGASNDSSLNVLLAKLDSAAKRVSADSLYC